MVRLVAMLLLALVQASAVRADEITLVAPGGIRSAIETLIPEFERLTGHTVRATFGSGGGTKQQVVRGDAFDVPIVQPPYPDVLASGHVVVSTETPLATVGVAVAVRKGDRKPDISTPDAVKRMLLSAKAISYPDGAAGAAAGVSVDRTLRALGIGDQMQPKIRRAQGGAGAMAVLAKGEVDIGLTFLSEMTDPGIDIVGILPREISTPTALVGFVSSHAKAPGAARALLRFLSSPAADAVYRSGGMEPSSAPRNDLPQPFRTTRDWGQLPPGVKWAAVTAIEPAPDGTVYVIHRCNANSCKDRPEAPILKYDANGTLLASWGAGMFVFPHGSTVDRDGNLWVTDAQGSNGKGHQVFKFSPDGRVLMTLGKAGVSGSAPDLFDQPCDVAVAPNGDIFVADSHRNGKNNRIVKFTKDGTFIAAWGKKGGGPGEFSEPHTIAFDSRGRLFVGDRENNRIQIFDQDGVFLAEWRQFGRPSGIAITADDTIYVADSESGPDTGAHERPGIKKGIRIGSARTGDVTAFIEDMESTTPDHSGAEGIGVDARGNVYGGVVRRQMLERHVRSTVASVTADELTVVTSATFIAAYKELVPGFEKQSGHRVTTEFGGSTGAAPDAIPNRLQRGEAIDVVIMAAPYLDEQIVKGTVIAGSRVDLVRSRIAMAVRAGAPKPDIRTVDALKRALIEAKSIGYSSSASGVYLSTELFPRLGIADQIRSKSTVIDGPVGEAVARGDVEIGFQQVSELLPVPGIEIVGPLPGDAQRVTIFAAGIVAGAKAPAAARALIEFLASPAAFDAIRKSGLDPAAQPR